MRNQLSSCTYLLLLVPISTPAFHSPHPHTHHSLLPPAPAPRPSAKHSQVCLKIIPLDKYASQLSRLICSAITPARDAPALPHYFLPCSISSFHFGFLLHTISAYSRTPVLTDILSLFIFQRLRHHRLRFFLLDAPFGFLVNIPPHLLVLFISLSFAVS